MPSELSLVKIGVGGGVEKATSDDIGFVWQGGDGEDVVADVVGGGSGFGEAGDLVDDDGDGIAGGGAEAVGGGEGVDAGIGGGGGGDEVADGGGSGDGCSVFRPLVGEGGGAFDGGGEVELISGEEVLRGRDAGDDGGADDGDIDVLRGDGAGGVGEGDGVGAGICGLEIGRGKSG